MLTPQVVDGGRDLWSCKVALSRSGLEIEQIWAQGWAGDWADLSWRLSRLKTGTERLELENTGEVRALSTRQSRDDRHRWSRRASFSSNRPIVFGQAWKGVAFWGSRYCTHRMEHANWEGNGGSPEVSRSLLKIAGRRLQGTLSVARRIQTPSLKISNAWERLFLRVVLPRTLTIDRLEEHKTACRGYQQQEESTNWEDRSLYWPIIDVISFV